MPPAIPLNFPSRYATSLPPVVRGAVIASVALVHVLGIWGLLQISSVREAVAEVAPIFVQWVAPPAPPVEAPPPSPLKPQPVSRKKAPPVIAAPKIEEALPVEFTVPEPPPEPRAKVDEPIPAVVASPIASAPVQAPPPPKTIPASAVRYRESPKPAYPALSKRLGEEGKVMIRVLIGVEGRAREVVLVESSGYVRLDEAALAAVRRASFHPYAENGVAMAVWAQIPIAFGLNR